VRLTQRPPVWRSRYLAPVYAAVISFGLIALAGALFPEHVEVAVSVTGPVQPDGLDIEVRDADGNTVAGGKPNAGQWSQSVPAGHLAVCVRADPPVRVAASSPSGACVPAQTPGPTSITVEPVRVIADGLSGSPAEATTVSVVDDAGRTVGSGVLDSGGRFTPPDALPTGGKVCLKPPAGRAVLAPPPGADGRPCRPVADRYSDVVFEVAAP
jgi:hypothetical protein